MFVVAIAAGVFQWLSSTSIPIVVQTRFWDSVWRHITRSLRNLCARDVCMLSVTLKAFSGLRTEVRCPTSCLSMFYLHASRVKRAQMMNEPLRCYINPPSLHNLNKIRTYTLATVLRIPCPDILGPGSHQRDIHLVSASNLSSMSRANYRGLGGYSESSYVSSQVTWR